MPLSETDIIKIENTIKNSLRNKFTTHNKEPASMPFHTRLLGKDRLALYAFIHSLNTNFGTSIFEPVAISLSEGNFKKATKQIKAGETISEEALYEIQKIMDNLTVANCKPDKNKEIETIRKACQKGKMRKVKPTKVDIYLESKKGELILIDLKTVKPNKGAFKEFKRTLLEWVAVSLYKKPDLDIKTLIAIPYNPYEPKPYSRWTIAGMLDLENKLKVAKEFWDFIGGEGAYEELLNCFERVGKSMRIEIDNFFEKFKNY